MVDILNLFFQHKKISLYIFITAILYPLSTDTIKKLLIIISDHYDFKKIYLMLR